MVDKYKFYKTKHKHDKPYSKEQTDFNVEIIPREVPRYRVWVSDYKIPIGANTTNSIKEIIEAFKVKGESISHIEEYIDGEWKQINYYI